MKIITTNIKNKKYTQIFLHKEDLELPDINEQINNLKKKRK